MTDTALLSRLGQISPGQRARLRARLAERADTTGPAPRQPPGSPAPLSHGQQRLWIIANATPGLIAYNETNLMALPARLDEAAFAHAFQALIERHEILRSRFYLDRDTPMQAPMAHPDVPLPLADLRHLPATDRQAEAERLARELGAAPIDLETGPPFRALLIRTGDASHALALVLHHIIIDGWALGIFAFELLALYWARAAGQPGPLRPLPIQYADFAAWQRRALDGPALAPQLAWWEKRLANLPRADLPADRPRPPQFGFHGGRVSLVLPPGLDAALDATARRLATSPNVVVLAATLALLHRLTGATDLAIGCPTSGRDRPETAGLIGFFINTLVLRVDASGGPSFATLVGRTAQAMAEALAHQDVPFEHLVQHMRAGADQSHTPFFQTMVNWWHSPAAASLPPELQRPMQPVGVGTAKFDLVIELIRTADGTRGHIEFNREIFDKDRIERLAAHLLRLLAAAAGAPDRPLSQLPLLSDADRHRILVEWNPAPVDFPRGSSLPALVAEVAAAHPDAIAVECGDHAQTHADLQADIAAVAARLAAAGIGPGSRVGVLLGRSAQVPAILLGIMAAGAAYVPLDPAAPPERLQQLTDDAALAALVALPPLPGLGRPAFAPEDLLAPTSAQPPANPVPGDDPACILYTSGTSGAPKGVVISHRNLARLVRGQGFAGWAPGKRCLHFAPLGFDASFLELWGCLANGGTLVIHPPGLPSLAELGRFIRAQRIDIAFLTTALFHRMVDSEPRSLARLSHLMTGGETLDPRIAAAAWSALPRTRLTNLYGPTECTCVATAWPIDSTPDSGPVPIGTPIANTLAYVLDAHGNPQPPGIPGELHLGGEGVASGYWQQPELTAERFIANPFGSGHLYRTGDIASWQADGTLRFHGRADRQIKRSGYRIELAEIEAAMLSHPDVTAAAMVVHGDQLHALAARKPGSALTDTALTRHLARQLPRHMLPGTVDVRAALPMVAAGKIDLQALQNDTPKEPSSTLSEPPRGPIEARLAADWQTLLGVAALGRHDNFFDLGGHSLIAMQLLSRVRDCFGTEISMARFFADPTLAGLAAQIDEH